MSRKRFHSKTPTADKVRREGQASFQETSKGTYSIRQNDRKVRIVTEDWEEANHSGKGIILHTIDGLLVGKFGMFEHNGTWTIYNRRIEDGFKGYNLGKLGFRLAEQVARQNKGSVIRMYTNQTDVISTALSIGYKFDRKEDKEAIKEALGIPPNEPLPNNQKLLEKLHDKFAETSPHSVWLSRQL